MQATTRPCPRHVWLSSENLAGWFHLAYVKGAPLRPFFYFWQATSACACRDNGSARKKARANGPRVHKVQPERTHMQIYNAINL